MVYKMIAILLADGFEEIEALTPLDMLRRAGLDVKLIGMNGKVVCGSHGICVICDMTSDEVELDSVSAVILPGGMPGSVNLDKAPFTDAILSAVGAKGGIIAAICAAPLVLGHRGLLKGKRATCYPGFEKELVGATVVESGVVTDGNVTTARGMGVALDFANELVSLICGKERADALSAAIMQEPKATVELEDKCEQSSSVELSGEGYPEEALENARRIVEFYRTSNISVSVTDIECGPRITRYAIVPANGVRVSSVVRLESDLKYELGSDGVRIQAPIPGKSAIGIEIPNKKPELVRLGEIVESDEFKSIESRTAFCIGKDVAGHAVFTDLNKLPHALIAGATGMGKSIFINSILTCILSKAAPSEVRLIMIDPKKIEFNEYNGIPHLITPVITEANQAAGALKWAIDQMEKRYELLSENSFRNVDAYNKAAKENPALGEPLPKIVIVIDELADLMLQLRNPVENLVMVIAQKARAAGIHLIIGTQRPSVNVLTGVIKANIPSRFTCKVVSNVDSRTIIEQSGAEKLLNRGDMLYIIPGMSTPERVQAPFVSCDELEELIDSLKRGFSGKNYDEDAMAAIDRYAASIKDGISFKDDDDDEEIEEDEGGYLNDETFLRAIEISVNSGKVSTSFLQRKLSIGFGKAAKYIELMEDLGIVSPPDGQKPREVLITAEEFRSKFSKELD